MQLEEERKQEQQEEEEMIKMAIEASQKEENVRIER